MDIMKKLLNIFVALSFIIGSAGCSGSDGGESPVNDGKLTLQADKTAIIANGADKVTFQVMLGGEDITSNASARLYLVERDGKAVSEKQASMQFASTVVGTYVFEARYEGSTRLVSDNKVTVTVSANNEEEVFYRKVFTQYFTSTGCHSCPNMNKALKSLSQEYQDRMVIGSFHMNYSAVMDPMAIDVTTSYMRDVLYTSGLPGCFLDLRSDTNCYGLTPEKTTMENIDRMLADYPAACGVKIDSKHDAAKGTITVKFTVKASVTNEYRILPFLVEDGIVANQDGGSSDYVHDNVVRAAGAASLVGDRLNTIEKDAEAPKSYTFNVQNGWNTDNMRVVVCVLNSSNGVDFYGNNAATCGIDESIDYLYNE